jgi:hypothetical protein
VARAKYIDDDVYAKELDRLRILRRFPELPAGQQDMVRTLRRITDKDVEFLHDLISWFVDNVETCPRPADLSNRAGEMRHREQKTLGNPACLKCDGTGWIHGTTRIRVKGLDPYDADWAKRCDCRPAPPPREG